MKNDTKIYTLLDSNEFIHVGLNKSGFFSFSFDLFESAFGFLTSEPK